MTDEEHTSDVPEMDPAEITELQKEETIETDTTVTAEPEADTEEDSEEDSEDEDTEEEAEGEAPAEGAS